MFIIYYHYLNAVLEVLVKKMWNIDTIVSFENKINTVIWKEYEYMSINPQRTHRIDKNDY